MAGDSMDVPMIFLRIGWMDHYRGQTDLDRIVGGGAFVKEHGYGHEIFNFQPVNGRVFGYVQPPGTANVENYRSSIAIDRMGAASGEESLSPVLAVWVARSRSGGSFIVGWYKNATVFRRWQSPPTGADRYFNGDECGYYVTTESSEAVVLPSDERVFRLSIEGKGKFGQANVWYADSDPDIHRRFRSQVLNYVATRKLPHRNDQSNGGTRSQPDPFLRPKIERAAIAATTKYYTGLGYTVDTVERDNVGWDLNAVHIERHLSLQLEVKGLQSEKCCVELTPNEYAKLKEHQDSYRVCIVTNTLKTPELSIFAYSNDSQQWEDSSGRVLEFTDIVAAKCQAGRLPRLN